MTLGGLVAFLGQHVFTCAEDIIILSSCRRRLEGKANKSPAALGKPREL
jgi:hypothetical protein